MKYSEYISDKCDEKALTEFPPSDYQWVARSTELYNNHMDFLFKQNSGIINRSEITNKKDLQWEELNSK